MLRDGSRPGEDKGEERITDVFKVFIRLPGRVAQETPDLGACLLKTRRKRGHKDTRRGHEERTRVEDTRRGNKMRRKEEDMRRGHEERQQDEETRRGHEERTQGEDMRRGLKERTLGKEKIRNENSDH